MKKIIATMVLILALGGIANAERTIILNKVSQLQGTLYFNPQVRIGTVTMHAPIGINVAGIAESTDGIRVSVSSSTIFGTLRKTGYTEKESWNLLPNALKPIFKDVHFQAIGVDLSQ